MLPIRERSCSAGAAPPERGTIVSAYADAHRPSASELPSAPPCNASLPTRARPAAGGGHVAALPDLSRDPAAATMRPDISRRSRTAHRRAASAAGGVGANIGDAGRGSSVPPEEGAANNGSARLATSATTCLNKPSSETKPPFSSGSCIGSAPAALAAGAPCARQRRTLGCRSSSSVTAQKASLSTSVHTMRPSWKRLSRALRSKAASRDRSPAVNARGWWSVAATPCMAAAADDEDDDGVPRPNPASCASVGSLRRSENRIAPRSDPRKRAAALAPAPAAATASSVETAAPAAVELGGRDTATSLRLPAAPSSHGGGSMLASLSMQPIPFLAPSARSSSWCAGVSSRQPSTSPPPN